jgi:hypothetical protein
MYLKVLQSILAANFLSECAEEVVHKGIPGRDRMRQHVQLEEAGTCIRAKALFRSALDLAREQAKFDSLLANALARHCRTSGLRKAACESPSA